MALTNRNIMKTWKPGLQPTEKAPRSPYAEQYVTPGTVNKANQLGMERFNQKPQTPWNQTMNWRKMANDQAALERRQKEDQINKQVTQIGQARQQAYRIQDMTHYQKMLQLAQTQANRGINAGLAQEENHALNAAKQAELGEAEAEFLGKNQELEDQRAQLSPEQAQRAYELYNQYQNKEFDQRQGWEDLFADRTQFQNALDWQKSKFDQDLAWKEFQFKNQSAWERAQYELERQNLLFEKHKFNSEDEWRRYAYTHMSAEDRMKLEANALQFNYDMAWKMYELDARTALEREGLVAMYGWTGKASGKAYGQTPGWVKSHVDKYAKSYGVDPKLVSAIIKTESNFNQNARSKAGAVGLMQLMPWAGSARFSAPSNVKIGTKYIADQIKAFGDIQLALAAYNWGPGNVRKAIKKYGNSWAKISKHAPKETRNYVKKVLGSM